MGTVCYSFEEVRPLTRTQQARLSFEVFTYVYVAKLIDLRDRRGS
jgi:hypothetical protein